MRHERDGRCHSDCKSCRLKMAEVISMTRMM